MKLVALAKNPVPGGAVPGELKARDGTRLRFVRWEATRGPRRGTGPPAPLHRPHRPVRRRPQAVSASTTLRHRPHAGRSSAVRGSAEEFCLVVTQRRNLADTHLQCEGDHARQWLAMAQAGRVYSEALGAALNPKQAEKA